MTQAETTRSYGRPDWAACDEQIVCPLCEYDLRGLSEPTCPECGYRFTWPDLLDPTRRRHPYLFEHHPHHNVWSFRKTAAAGLMRRRFWTSLVPSQPSRPRRLVLYWLIAGLMGYVLALAWHGTDVSPAAGNFPALLPASVWSSNGVYRDALAISSVRRGVYISVDFSRSYVFRIVSGVSEVRFIALVMLAPLLWPWLTFLALLVFQTTMRRSKLRASHVARCVVYCGDVTLWVGLLLLVGGIAAAFTGLAFPGSRVAEYLALGAGSVGMLEFLGLLLVTYGVAVYRLCIAYRRYLHFADAVATILLSQVIVVLVCLVALLNLPH